MYDAYAHMRLALRVAQREAEAARHENVILKAQLKAFSEEQHNRAVDQSD